MLDPYLGNEAVALPGDYPKAAYRLGTEMEVWGRMMDMRLLADREDEASAIADGWALHPLDVENHEPLTVEHVDTPRRGPGRPRKTEA